MTDKKEAQTETIEIPKGAIAADVSGTPLGALASLVGQAPKPIAAYLQMEIGNFATQLCARVAALTHGGEYIAMKDYQGMEETFAGATADAAKYLSAEQASQITPQLERIALDIAQQIDRGIATRFITAENEEAVNHDAYLDIIAGHATVMRGIMHICDVPADYEVPADDERTVQ
jgi:hypothetical protein